MSDALMEDAHAEQTQSSVGPGWRLNLPGIGPRLVLFCALIVGGALVGLMASASHAPYCLFAGSTVLSILAGYGAIWSL